MTNLLHAGLLVAQSGPTRRWTPFVDPLSLAWPGLHDMWWLTLLPLAFFISLAYKGVRLEDLSRWPRQVALMTTQIILAMIALAIGLYVLIEVIVPFFDR